MKQYTNDLTSEIIHGIKNPHSESELDNGDVIVSTPKNGRMLVEFNNNRFGDDFLKPEILEV